MELEPQWRGLHPSSLLFDAGRRFLTLVWAVAVVLFASSEEERWYWLFLILPVASALVRYFSFRYAFSADELVVREGWFTRNVRHVPYARIQNVDTVQGPLHRLLDVVEVRLETASGGAPEAVFRVIRQAQLAELRARVFGEREQATTVDEAFEPARAERGELVHRMPGADIVWFGLLSQRGLVLVGAFLVALRELQAWDAFEQRLERLGEDPLSEAGLSPWAWLALAVSFLVLLQLLTTLWAWVTLHGFRLERVGEDLRASCGLITRQTASLPRARIQFLEVRQGVLERCFGRASVRALSAGGDSTQESQIVRKWLVPLCRQAEVPRILRAVQDEATFEAQTWRPIHPRAWRRIFVRWALLFVPLAVLAGRYSLPTGFVLGLVGLPCAFGLARIRARALGWAVGEGAVFLRDGILGRRLACVRFEKIQSISLRQTPLDRRARMARLSVDTAAGPGQGRSFEIPLLGLRDALRLERRLAQAVERVQFRW